MYAFTLKTHSRHQKMKQQTYWSLVFIRQHLVKHWVQMASRIPKLQQDHWKEKPAWILNTKTKRIQLGRPNDERGQNSKHSGKKQWRDDTSRRQYASQLHKHPATTTKWDWTPKWSKKVRDSIDITALKELNKRLDFKNQTARTKFVFDQWQTGHRQFQVATNKDPTLNLCPSCNERHYRNSNPARS